jgi:diaminopropionate ammonia-lyase
VSTHDRGVAGSRAATAPGGDGLVSPAAQVAGDGPAVALLQPHPVRSLELGPATSPRSFHASMPGYRPTALRSAPAAAARLGVAEVLVKDESARLGLPSFKVLGASWAVYRALLDRLGVTPEQVPTFTALTDAVRALGSFSLSAATDGNHGRAVAHMAALLGLGADIYVPENTVTARIDAIAGEGARVTVVAGGYDDAVRRSAQDASDRCLVISDTSWEGYEQVPGWVIEGYATVLDETEEQLEHDGGRRPDVVAVPIGVGALAAAVVRHFWAPAPAPTLVSAPRPAIVGVEPTSAACVLESVAAGRIVTLTHPQESIMAGLNCATPSLIAWPVISRGIDAYVAVPDARVPEAMRLLADDGIVAGETGAGGLAGMLALASDPQTEPARRSLGLDASTRVLLLCTEGATDPGAYDRLIAGAPRR